MTSPALLVMVPYAAIAVCLTIWLARTLSRHGLVFLQSVFPGREDFAAAVNQLLVIGFYLVNIGWSLLLLRASELRADSMTMAASMLVDRLGVLLLLLGLAHMFNLFVFHRIRRNAARVAM